MFQRAQLPGTRWLVILVRLPGDAGQHMNAFRVAVLKTV